HNPGYGKEKSELPDLMNIYSASKEKWLQEFGGEYNVSLSNKVRSFYENNNLNGEVQYFENRINAEQESKSCFNTPLKAQDEIKTCYNAPLKAQDEIKTCYNAPLKAQKEIKTFYNAP